MLDKNKSVFDSERLGKHQVWR